MLYIDDHWQCGICNGQWWPPEKPERGPYKKIIKDVPIDSPELMLWHEEDMNYKPPLPPGEPYFKGGGSKSGKRRKKPVKRNMRIVYET
jgi:hypothetical protein